MVRPFLWTVRHAPVEFNMQTARLLPKEKSECVLRVWVEDRLQAEGLVVRRGLLAEQLLTSVHYGQVVLQLLENKMGMTRLAPDRPDLTPQQRSNLDRHGVVRVGTRLAADDVLASLFDVKRREGARTRDGVGERRDRIHARRLGWSNGSSRDASVAPRKSAATRRKICCSKSKSRCGWSSHWPRAMC